MRRVEGLCYFAYTPDQCNADWDANHGGLFKKNRLDHEWCHDGNCGGLYVKATGPPGNEFSGNNLGDMFGCGTLYPLGNDQGLWFHEITGIYWRGLVPNWYSGCDGMPGCSSDCSFGDTLALPPEIPGYGYHGANGECVQFRVPPNFASKTTHTSAMRLHHSPCSVPPDKPTESIVAQAWSKHVRLNVG